MWVKKPKNHQDFSLGKIETLFKAITFKKWFVLISLIFITLGYYSYRLYKSPFFQTTAIGKISNFRDDLFSLYLAKIGYKVDAININIKFVNLQKLAYKREQILSALSEGVQPIYFSSDDDTVKASITSGKKNYKAEIRLKGDIAADHLKPDKWSFRIKIKDGDTLFGMRNFSIHAPGTRNYLYEWVFHKILELENIISLRYKFIKVSINGKYHGIYALEEFFDKELIENNKFREGPILKLSEDKFWLNYLSSSLVKAPVLYIDDYLESTSSISGFNLGKTLSTPGLKDSFIEGYNLLYSFRSGKLPASKVFDIEKLGKYFALCDVIGGKHALRWHNLRFYYNPVTSLLEPIGFDANAGEVYEGLAKNPRYQKALGNTLEYHLFQDAEFTKSYLTSLRKFISSKYFTNAIRKIEKKEKIRFPWINLYKQNSFLCFNFKKISHNQKELKKFLNTTNIYISNVTNDTSSTKIELNNLSNFLIEIDHLEINMTSLIPNEKNKILVEDPYEQKNNYLTFSKGLNESDLSNSIIYFRYPGLKKIRNVKPKIASNKKFIFPRMNIDSNNFSFFTTGHIYDNASGINKIFKDHFKTLSTNKTLFGILCGDLVANSTHENWKNLDKDISTLKKPIFFALGNRDISGDKKLFENRYYRPYYSFEIGQNLFLILNSECTNSYEKNSQLDFVKDTINRPYKNVFIFFHSVLWATETKYEKLRNSVNYISTYYYKYSKDFWLELKNLLKTKRLNTYIFSSDAGEIGGFPLSYLEEDNLHLILSAVGKHALSNYLIISVKNDKVNIKAIPLDNTINIKNIKNYNLNYVYDKTKTKRKDFFLYKDILLNEFFYEINLITSEILILLLMLIS